MKNFPLKFAQSTGGDYNMVSGVIPLARHVHAVTQRPSVAR